jgi:putative Ca2+/H+ antiporter (TMEM165/GDT1 family)
MFRIHCSQDKPSDASVSVSYRDKWFWIDDRDLRTKRAFALMFMLFALADTGDKESLPLITIPAQ